MFILAFFLLLFHRIPLSKSCTSFLASPGSTKDGDAFITYNSDGFTTWCWLWYSPAQDWPNGTMIRGKIPQVPHTLNVVHLVNEKGLAFGETTWSYTRPGMTSQKGAIIDYPLLMNIVLQRCSTAREAIVTIGQLLDKYGYSSNAGETFSIGDPNEVWIMDLVGKGDFEQPKLGAVWVARRVPSGFVSGHANQARIQRFPLNDPDNCLYHPDAIKFARDRGWYSGPDQDFSFSDIYSPVSFESARWCEARVWDMFNSVSDGMGKYLDYAQGLNLTNRLPLWVKPTKEMDLQSVIAVKRSHFEGTWFDMVDEFDVGDQPFHSGDRFEPLKWKATNGNTYVFERSISIQKTCTTKITQLRNWYPDGIGPIEWFSLDDTMTNVYVPLYSGLTSVPPPYTLQHEFSYDSAFWMLNLVSNYAYYRYDAIAPQIKLKQAELESKFVKDVMEQIDGEARFLYQNVSPEAAYKFVSNFSVSAADDFLLEWKGLFGSLFSTFFDSAKFNSGYDQQWYDMIAQKTGDHFLYRGKDPL